MSFAAASFTSRTSRPWLPSSGKRFPNVPVFLVGTSRGSISVAALGARFDQRIAGLVLTSTMFRAARGKAKEQGPGLSGIRFCDDQDSGAVRAPRERPVRVHAVQRRSAAVGPVSLDRGIRRRSAAVRTLRSVQRPRLYWQRAGDGRTNYQLDAEETVSSRSEVGGSPMAVVPLQARR